jgi:hypothetical protein
MTIVFAARCGNRDGDSTAASACPACGAADPSGRRSARLGAAFLGLLGGAALTGLYAWVIRDRWERWAAQFAGLPDDHPLSGAASEVAVAVGVSVFLAGWVVCALGVWRRVRTP